MSDVIERDAVKQAYVYEDADGTIDVDPGIAVIIISHKNVVASASLDEQSEMFCGVISSSRTKKSTPVIILESPAIFNTSKEATEYMKRVIKEAVKMHQKCLDEVVMVSVGANIG